MKIKILFRRCSFRSSALFLICLCAVVAGQAMDSACLRPDVLFCTGFEEANWRAQWDDYDGNPAGSNDLITDPGPANIPGNHVMRLRSPAQARGGADLVKVLGNPQQGLYARWYQKWETGYNFSAGCHNGGLHAGSRDFLGASDNRPSGSDWFSAWLEPCGENRFHFYAYYRGMYMDCANPAGSCWGDHLPCMLSGNYCTNPKDNAPPRPQPPTVAANRWYCFEIMADAGTPTTDTGAVPPHGVLDFWVDGVEYGPFENLWLSTAAAVKPCILYLSLFNHDATHSVEGIMVDDVVMATAPVGPRGGTGVQKGTSGRSVQDFSVCQFRNGRFVFNAGPSPCELFLHDISGKQICTCAPAAGSGLVEWMAPALLPGVYIASLRYNGKIIVKKAAMVR